MFGKMKVIILANDGFLS